jgi:hypothetical protein
MERVLQARPSWIQVFDMSGDGHAPAQGLDLAFEGRPLHRRHQASRSSLDAHAGNGLLAQGRAARLFDAFRHVGAERARPLAGDPPACRPHPQPTAAARCQLPARALPAAGRACGAPATINTAFKMVRPADRAEDAVHKSNVRAHFMTQLNRFITSWNETTA